MEFGQRVAGESVAADAYDICGLPSGRPCLGLGDGEFDGQTVRFALGQSNVRVNALHERVADLLSVRRIACPLRCHVATEQECPRCDILREVSGAEIGSKQAQSTLAPKIDLPKTVARSVEALQEKEIVFVFSPNMRNAPRVDANLGGLVQALDNECLARCGSRSVMRHGISMC